MPVKLFVGGLSFTTSNESLRDAFARFGTVSSAIVMTDRATGRSRGFGFVEMATEDESNRAISGLNGSQLDGRMIRVDKATPRGAGPVRRPGGPPSPRPGSGGGGFAPRPPAAGGFDVRPPFGQDAGGRRGQGRNRGRPGDSEQRRPGGRRGGKPLGERRAGDKGRRSEEGYRW